MAPDALGTSNPELFQPAKQNINQQVEQFAPAIPHNVCGSWITKHLQHGNRHLGDGLFATREGDEMNREGMAEMRRECSLSWDRKNVALPVPNGTWKFTVLLAALTNTTLPGFTHWGTAKCLKS